jgi:hypothetical protein
LQQQTLLRFRCWKFSSLLQNLNARIRVWSCCRNLCLSASGIFSFLGCRPCWDVDDAVSTWSAGRGFSGRKKSAREEEKSVGGGEK